MSEWKKEILFGFRDFRGQIFNNNIHTLKLF